MQKLLGFLPDVDPTTPGVVTSCTNFIPWESGMKGAPTGVTPSDVPALAAACIGAAVVTKLDDTRRIFAGTTTKLYELSSGSWVDRSGSAYNGGVDTRWSYAQFGDSTLAANLADTIQRSTSGAFADIATAPKAKIIFSVGSFVMALNTSDTTYGVQPDRWWCCASYDDTSWTPDLSTLATTGRLVSTPGRFVAGGRLGEYAIAYKERAIYLGQFVGSPIVWDWVQVPGGDAGCVGLEAWCDVGGVHFIVGQDNFWLFDGSRPIPIGSGEVRQWFFDNSNPSYRYKTRCVFDRQNNLVWCYYCSTSSTSTIDSALVYHVQTKQWGHVTTSNEAVLNYVSSGVTIDDLPNFSATVDGLSGYSFDSQFWFVGGRSLAAFDTSHQLKTITGVTATSGFTTGDFGDDDNYSLLSKVRVRFTPGYKPSASTITTYTKATSGDGLTVGQTGSINDGKFDVLQSARFHRFALEFTGDNRVIGIGVEIKPEGNN
jgi:hypothetical protein